MEGLYNREIVGAEIETLKVWGWDVPITTGGLGRWLCPLPRNCFDFLL